MPGALNFSNEHVTCTVTFLDEDKIQVSGRIASPGEYESMEVLAPCPIDRRTAYHGSGLPFPCPSFALENTPNHTAPDKEGRFQAVFEYPNSYYTYDGKTRVPPSLFVILKPAAPAEPVYVRFELPDRPTLPLRTLTHRAGRAAGPAFYSSKDGILDPIPESAEQVMRTMKEYKEKRDMA